VIYNSDFKGYNSDGDPITGVSNDFEIGNCCTVVSLLHLAAGKQFLCSCYRFQ